MQVATNFTVSAWIKSDVCTLPDGFNPEVEEVTHEELKE